jgi:hypothetical protein
MCNFANSILQIEKISSIFALEKATNPFVLV